ncbi:lytic transglycosylase domain-containing protein [Natronoflexus pectinivorans]|uniref:LysM domain-containing protein n=1 Tax=Natronoflexus pectinivorans TaxID=682526 RepID=A0A4R2GIE9_9BACT|nr:lytic transglycosylase domain-containing protein [Natronoflexus pectinivorans]TCO07980.1 LysM domain-containing protein [Natronoflexus pectinivorans]
MRYLFVSLLLFFIHPAILKSEENNKLSASIVESRLEILDALTPMPLVYNSSVQAYIDVYTVRRRDHLAGIIGRSELYFPLFEEYLDKMGLPLELKYLAVVESALEPRARSTSGAKGLWQFLFQASRLFDMQVTSYIDERADPVKSTEAACKYLKYLYDNFHDWNLVLAAYNGGIAAVKEAIEKSGGKTDYWDIRPYLPVETQGYIPAFIAVNYAMNYYPEYEITPKNPPFTYDDLGFVNLDFSISFKQLSEFIDIPVEMIRLLNPVYSKDFIPVTESPVQIVIPKDKVIHFIENRRSLIREVSPPVEALRPFGFNYNKKMTRHTVQRGEFFHRIAMSYRVRVEDIMKWNNLNSRNLYAGQQLVIWYQPEENPFFFVNKEYPLLAN